jgi:hypothetical protein
MKIAIDLVKNIVLPEIKKDLKFDLQKLNADFWEKFSTDLLHFEADAKPLYASIYSLELAYAEKIIDKLWGLYSKLIEELAESYALGQPSEAADYLLKTDNEIFLKKVGFLKTMQQAIKSVERKSIKADLPKSYERLTFELSDTDLANASRKTGRVDLKEKMKKWDKELVEESTELVTANLSEPKLSYNLDQYAIPRSKSKVISLSWMKYAVAASIIMATGIFYFKNIDLGIVPTENSVVTTPDKKEDKKDIQKPEMFPPAKAAASIRNIVFTSNRTVMVLEPSFSLGYASNNTKEKVSVFFKDVPFYILRYEKVLKNLKNEKSVTKDNLEFYKKELATLKKENGKYEFKEGELFLYEKDTKDYKVLLTEEHQYYLKKGETYYTLKVTETPLPLEKVTDAITIETLEKISFENE